MPLGRIIALAAGLLGPAIAIEAVGAAFLEPLPFARPEELVEIRGLAHPRGAEYADLLEGSPTVEAVTTLRWGRATWSRPDEVRRIDVLLSDHLLLPVLGLTPVVGRTFSRRDLKDPTTVLVSPAVWQELEHAGGRQPHTMELNGRVYEVIGVAPLALSRFGPFHVILPRNEGRPYGPRIGEAESAGGLLIGRRRPSASLSDVQANMERLQRSKERPEGSHSRVTVTELTQRLTSSAVPTMQIVLFSGALLFLLATVTVGMVAAMQGVERLGEFEIKAALGATRGRLRLDALQPWLRAMPLSTACALIVALPLSQAIRSTLPPVVAVPVSHGQTAFVIVLFAFLLTLVAAACALIPHHIAKGTTSRATNLSARAPRWSRVSGLLALAQVALSVALLCASAVAVRGLVDQGQRDLGMRWSGIQVMDVDLGEGLPPESERIAWARLEGELARYKGRVSTGSALPWESRLSLYMSNPSTGSGDFIACVRAGGGFFPLLGIRLLAGADPFSSGVATDAVVVSQAAAHRLGLVAGATISIPDAGGPEIRRVAGIVTDAHDPSDGPEEKVGHVYLMAGTGDSPGASMSLFVRGSAREALDLRTIVGRALPGAAISQPAPLGGRLATRIQKQTVAAWVLAGYALLAALLVAIGLSGLMRRRVAQRLTEVGVRLALGASRRQIDRTMLRALLAPATIGVGAGVLCGVYLSKVVASLMLWAKPLDPLVYGGGAIAGVALVLISAWPALRAASRVQPADLLRQAT
jgi:putative ABC transport system permease protein